MGQARKEGAGQQQLDKGHRRATAREKPEGHLRSASPPSNHASEQLSLQSLFAEEGNLASPTGTDFNIISIPLLNITH